MKVAKSVLAKESELHRYVGEGDFLDCYTVRIDQPKAPIQEIAQRIFTDLPGWINALLAIRDLGVTPFRLKTTAKLPKDNRTRSSVEVGEPINFLAVRSISENEIILGEDDSHLDFKISVYRDPKSPGRVSLATWARTHNRFGKLYLGIITPFHIMIVNARLAGLAKHYAHRHHAL